MKKTARSFRLVCAHNQTDDVEALLHAEGFRFEPHPCFALARTLTAEPMSLGRSVAARFGYIYIQDKSSMLPPLALAPKPGDKVLDFCASPGSKTGILSQLVGPT
ncbi:MAG: RsmB/NOP family class I SAM-dependent RNA methyltransferase, partial [Desulfomicrobium sp.]|nr:RsmB/NOP family class I SAM-dependent RNA methyltransferase [Desulfomicrobium sp.]